MTLMDSDVINNVYDNIEIIHFINIHNDTSITFFYLPEVDKHYNNFHIEQETFNLIHTILLDFNIGVHDYR